MPPKVKITKENIIGAAIDIARQNGADSINARSLAAHLDCSTQPIFSNFVNMDELHLAVLKNAYELYDEYIRREIANGKYPPYKSSGMAYIRSACEEKELFKEMYSNGDFKAEATESICACRYPGFGQINLFAYP